MKNNKLSIDGFLFILNKKLKERFYWICDQYSTIRCTGRAISIRDADGNHKLLKKTAHSHTSSSHRCAVEEAKTCLRLEASRDTHGTASEIVDKINTSAAVIDNEISTLMGTEKSLRQIVRRVKKKNAAVKYPAPPKTMDFVFDLNFEGIKFGDESLLLYDYISEDKTKRISIFTKDSLFEHFCRANLIVSDGTFKTCPFPYKQLFIIHGNIPGYDDYFTYPLIWILMSGKEEELYVHAFNALREYAINMNLVFNAQYSLCDFEAAIRNSIQLVFPGIINKACFMHYRQIVIAKLKKMKLISKYQKDPNFAYEINLVVALAFFPPDEIEALFTELYGLLSVDAKNFCDWFQTNYIRKPDGRDARNPPTFWSIYDMVYLGLPKTQCGAEQSHHSLFLACHKEPHLPLYKILNILKQQMIKSDQNINRVKSGVPVKHRTKFYEVKENLIHDIINKKDDPNRPLMESLRQIATILCSINHLILIIPE